MSDQNSASKDKGNNFTAGHSSATDTRPGTAGSMTASDPFSTPLSSRAPSIKHQPPSPDSSKVSFPDTFLSGPRKSYIAAQQTAYTSARFSTSRLSAAIHATSQTKLGTKPKIARMKSHMLPEGDPLPKPWKEGSNPRAAFAYWIVYVLLFFGIAGGAVQCYFTFVRVPLDKQPLCLVLQEDFNNEAAALGEGGTFFREVNMDGFGNGEFEMTTNSRNNSFVQDGMLYIVPTLTSDNIGMDSVLDGTVYNITGCTFNITRPDNGFITQNGQRVFDSASYYRSCSAVSNSTAGTVINPVQSARLTTKYSASIRYGRVEIRAKMPNGDWMWPAMWMLPKDEVYGPWPLSGEIDLVESRGNGLRYTAHGSNYVQGALNWGPALNLNGVSKSYSWWSDKRKSFASDFHTYTLEWTPEFLRISVDTRLHTLLDFRFNQPFFQRGDFPDVVFNGSSLVPLTNPWINGTNATPFDQDFYLILNVAVGATTGWFPEGQGDKPWLDQAQNPRLDFIRGIKQWYPTWPTNLEDRAMIVDYVKMWKHC